MKTKFVQFGLLASILFISLIYSCSGDKETQQYNNATLKLVQYSPEYGIIYDKNDKFITTYRKDGHTLYIKGSILWDGDNKGILYYNDSIISGSYSKFLDKEGVNYLQSNINDRGVWLINQNSGMAVANETSPSREAIDSLDFEIQTCNDPEIILKAVNANNGDLAAMLDIGELYERGNTYIRINKNLEKSLSWYEKAGQGGNGEGYYRLALLYMHGFSGVSKNEDKALYYYDLAAKLGHKDAADSYRIYSRARGIEPMVNNQDRESQISKTSPSSVAEKITMGNSLGDIDFEVMIRYCQKHNEDAKAVTDDALSGDCEWYEIETMMLTLHERYPYIELFLEALGDNRGRMTQEQKDKCTDIANEIKKQYSRVKNR